MQTNIIRTQGTSEQIVCRQLLTISSEVPLFSLWEMGSDDLFSLAGSRKPISETVSSGGRKQSHEAQELVFFCIWCIRYMSLRSILRLEKPVTGGQISC